MPRRHNALWLTIGVMTVVAWALGYVFWAPESGGEYGTYFDLFFPAILVVTGLPLAILAGFLMSRRKAWRVLGYVLLAIAAFDIAYLAFFAFFGGFCLDPGEVCVTTWPSRFATLCVALGCVGAGWAGEQLAVRLFRPSRPRTA